MRHRKKYGFSSKTRSIICIYVIYMFMC